MRKNKIIALSTLAAAGVLGMGAFAFFSDHSDQTAEGTIGTVDIQEGEGLKLENSGNFNPGDETPTPGDPDNPQNTTPHSLTFGIQNSGTKSVITRNIIDITVKGHYAHDEDNKLIRKDGEDGAYVTVDEYMKEHTDYDPFLQPDKFQLYVKRESGNVLIENAGFGATRFVYTRTDEATKKEVSVLRYIIPGAILDGTGTAAETGDASDTNTDNGMEISENGTKVNYTYYLGMDADTPDSYQGASITVDLYVQAMQYRNTDKGANDAGNDKTDKGDWETVFSDTVVSSDDNPSSD